MQTRHINKVVIAVIVVGMVAGSSLSWGSEQLDTAR